MSTEPEFYEILAENYYSIGVEDGAHALANILIDYATNDLFRASLRDDYEISDDEFWKQVVKLTRKLLDDGKMWVPYHEFHGLGVTVRNKD